MSGLTLEKVGRDFGGLPAVDSLTLRVPKGRITGLIGPNGAGKTTVVNMITGLLKVTRGSILLGDRDVTELPAHDIARLGVARTFQNIRLIREQTVLESVVAGFHRHEEVPTFAKILGLPMAYREQREFRERAHALLERFRMVSLAKSPVGGLSYGHQRRVEMMRALAMDPEVLLLDEPVAGMNDSEAYSLADIFQSIVDQGVAILLIEHNMRFVRRLCQHVYVLNSGRLIADGGADEVVGDPRVIEAYLGG